MILKVYIFDAQPQAFHEPQSAAIHDLHHEFVWSGHLGDDGFGFLLGEDGGNALAFFGADEIENFTLQLDVEDVAIEEEDGADRLILGGGGGFTFDDEMGDELVDLRDAHFARVAFVVKENVFTNPVNVGFFGARGVLLDADLVAQ